MLKDVPVCDHFEAIPGRDQCAHCDADVAAHQQQASPLTFDSASAMVRHTLNSNNELLQRYHELWYGCPHTWGSTTFLGVNLLKAPNDLWAYQEIIARLRPTTIIETGTLHGGSALWFASLMDLLHIDGQVITIDVNDQRRCSHPKMRFVLGSSADEEIAQEIAQSVEYPLLVVLDSDHSEAHVRRELDLYAPLCHVGDRLVVEDTNVSFPGDRGALGAAESYLRDHLGEFVQDVTCERWLLTCHPGGWWVRVAACAGHYGKY